MLLLSLLLLNMTLMIDRNAHQSYFGYLPCRTLLHTINGDAIITIRRLLNSNYIKYSLNFLSSFFFKTNAAQESQRHPTVWSQQNYEIPIWGKL